MKTNQIRLTIAVAALAAALNSSLNAAEKLHSPRGRDNEIRRVPGVTPRSTQPTNQFLHRGDLVAHPTVKGIRNEPNLALENRGVVGSPRAVEVFPHLRNTTRLQGDVVADARDQAQ